MPGVPFQKIGFLNRSDFVNYSICLDANVTTSSSKLVETLFTRVNVITLKLLIITFISVAIVFCNIINIYIVSITKQLPRITRICLLNLSFGDLLVGLVSCLPSVPAVILGHWPYGPAFCQIAGIIHGSSVTISIWSLSLISIDRYLAITKPLKFKIFLRPRRTYLIICVMWFLALSTFTSPLLTKSNFIYYKFSPDELICGLYWEYKWFCVITAIYIPVASGTVLIFTNTTVLRKVLSATRVKNPRMTSSSSALTMYSNMRINDVRAVKLLIIASVVYFLLWGPYVSEVVAISLFDIRGVPSDLKFLTMWLANSNSFTNVFIYSATYQSFRINLKILLNKICCCGRCKEVYSRRDHESISAERSFQLSQYG